MAEQQDVQAVLRSQEFFRLKQVVQSPGDIYELEESSRAIYIGPDSDIAEVEVQYYDPDVPGSVQTATVAVNGPFVGRMDALLATKIPSTGQLARILVSPVDLVDNNYVPPNSPANRTFNVPASIDVIVALKTLPAIPAVRGDRTFRFPNVPYFTGNHPGGPPSNDGSTNIIVPIYGRRLVTVDLIATTIAIMGTISLATVIPGEMANPRIISRLLTTATLGPPSVRTMVYRASDAARGGLTYDTASPPAVTGEYIESDQSAGTVNVAAIDPEPRGQADLLVINIAAATPVMVGVLEYVDLFITLSDTET